MDLCIVKIGNCKEHLLDVVRNLWYFDKNFVEVLGLPCYALGLACGFSTQQVDVSEEMMTTSMKEQVGSL